MQKCNFHYADYAAMSIWRHRSWNLWISQKCESLDISRTNYYLCFKYQELPSYQENPVTKNSGKVSGIKATHGSWIPPKVKKQITNIIYKQRIPQSCLFLHLIFALYEKGLVKWHNLRNIYLNKYVWTKPIFFISSPWKEVGFLS